MRTQQQSSALLAQLHDPIKGALSENAVAHGKSLVHNEDVRVHTGRHRKRQAHLHAAGIGFDGHVKRITEAAEIDDGVNALLNLGAAHTHGRGVQIDVFTPGGLRVEARSEFQQRRNAPPRDHLACGRREGSGGQLQQG